MRERLECDPITRDLRAYAYGATAVVLCAIVILIVGLTLKMERKQVRDAQNCYVWIDGHKTCKAIWPTPYVCTPHDRERGECE